MTGTNIAYQLTQTLYMSLIGFSSLFLLDFTYEIGRQAKWNRYQRIAADLLCVFCCGICFYIILIWQNQGMLCSYILFGLAVGAGLYCGLLRRFFRKFCRIMAHYVLRFCNRLATILSFPWRFLYRHIVRPIKGKIYRIRQARMTQELNDDELEEII